MYRLLIVDDEDHLRSLIVNQVDWAGLGFDVASACNGQEAMNIAKDFAPQALLTDIRMPFIDGLELIKILKKDNPELYAIVLSGHDEFAYAKNSLQMGVTDYLLKPIRPAMLASTMKELKSKMDEDFAQRSDIEKIQLQLEESLPFLRQQYLLILINDTQPADVISQQFRYLGIDIRGSSYTLSVLDHDAIDNPADKFFTFYAIQNILQQYFTGDSVCFFDNDGRHYILSALSDEGHTREGITRSLQQALSDISQKLSFTATAAVGSDVASLSDLTQSLTTALAALDNRVIGGKGKVYDARGYLRTGEARPDYSFSNASDIISRLPYEQKDVFSHSLESLFGEIRGLNCTDITFLQIIFVDLINNSHKLLSENSQKPEHAEGDIYHKLFKLKTLGDMQQLAEGYILQIKDSIDAGHKEKQQNLVALARDYIDGNFCDPSLSLSGVAQMFYVSPSYLSNLFKRKYDMNFIDYVTRLRMAKAMELLSNSDLKAYEIAQQVGYNDPQYFSNSFKKFTGSTPSDYKTSISGRKKQ